ncbi:MAG: hypothetical protein KJ904_04945 [Alphaproteobacteria bacterium]|nr:hypothetical protein [Alphaproteobacteria bacterium]MBU0886492.1 hypothetical protein [Alphaproteobacteria bacterium]MBU1812285.1 hypothetical protein [Alphaproteobacteria bacterium]
MASTFIIGTEGADLLNGAAGNDTIRGLGGNDTVNGSEGNDDLDGGDGNDSVIGGAGNDVIQGGKGADTISGGAGGDIIRGGKGQDSLEGGEGNDTIYSGYGQDTLTGGSGTDVFVLKGKQDAANPAALVTPTITDFVAGTDTVAIEGVTADEITTALAGQTTVDGGVSFKIGDGTIVVKGTGLTTLTSANVTTTSAIPDAPVAGSTFTLTTGTDVIAGTSGNDTIIGDFGGSTTVNAADQIDGGAGTDTLKLFGTPAALPAGTTNIEVLNYVTPGTGTIDLTGAPTGVTRVQVDQMKGGTITSTGRGGITLDLATLNNTDVGGAVTWAANATDTTLNLELSGYSNATGQALSITGAAATTLNITTDTAASKVTTLTGPATATTVNLAVGSGANLTIGTSLAASAAKTVNISGAGKATISGSDLAATVTVDASTNTGGVSYTGEAGSTLTFKGGSGNDTLTAAFADITTADTLTGGAGTDTLALSTAGTLTTSGALTAINKATGFETLQFGASDSVDVGLVTNGITNFKTAAGNFSLTATNSLSTTTYTVDNSASNTGTVSVSNKVGETSASVTIDAGAAVANQTLAELTFTGVTNVGLVSTGTGTGSANTITNLNTTDNSVITITGSKALTLTNAIDGTATGSKVDASALTGKLTMTGSGFADVIITGTGGSVIDGGAGKDTITGGSGADRINVTTATSNDDITMGGGADTIGFSGNNTALYALSTGTTDVVNVTDFVAGTDKIALVNTTGAFTSVTLATQTIATAADLTAVWAAVTQLAVSASGGAAAASVITVSAGAAAGTYLYVNDTTAAVNSATDLLVDITGVTGTLATTDFVFA